MRVRRFLHLILFAVAALLLWQGVSTWGRTVPVPLPTTTRGGTEEPPLVVQPARVSAVGAQFAEIIADKDLFAPTRKRATVAGPQATSVPPPSHLKLVGVLLFSDRQEALLADSSQGGKVAHVRQGESIGSYRLIKMTAGQITLALGQDGGEVTLPLTVVDSQTAARAPRLMPTQRPGVPGRPPGPLVRGQPVPPRPGQPVPVPQQPPQPTQEETQAIRQNIQRLQQRLRQMRRQAARETAEEPDPSEEEEDSGDENNGDEE